VDRAISAVRRRIPSDVRLLRDSIARRLERLALLHSSVEGIPPPIVGAVHVAEHALPGIDLVLTRTGHVQSIDGGAACISCQMCDFTNIR
jgi:hypothetical protein